jgi:hypothetical protein
MNDALLMRGVERCRHLAGNSQRVLVRQRPGPGQAIGQRPALHQLHLQEPAVGGFLQQSASPYPSADIRWDD